MKRIVVLSSLVFASLQGEREDPLLHLEPFLPPLALEESRSGKQEASCGTENLLPKKEEVSLEEISSLKTEELLFSVPKEKEKAKKSAERPMQELPLKRAALPERDFPRLPQFPEDPLLSLPLPQPPEEMGHSINFSDIPMEEFLRFVSKISEVNFIFNKKELNFSVSLSSGKAVSARNVLNALLGILRMHGFWVKKEEEYYVIHKVDPSRPPPSNWDHLFDLEEKQEKSVERELPQAAEEAVEEREEKKPREERLLEFFVYKLKYHQGPELLEALKQVALELKMQPDSPERLLSAIQTVQFVRATNSLLFSGDEESIQGVKKLIESLDTALKQVFIEILVIETDVSRAFEFGLQWAGGGKVGNNLGMGAGGFPRTGGTAPFADTMQGISGGSAPTGLDQFPIGSGFDLGVIGDIIFHKGKSFLSLGALVSAIQAEGGSTIVLNQKIIAQDNKPSKIFVGDNIPFTGSVTQIVGQSQQRTSNIEYRDIGVNLNITPMIGDGDVITLDLQEEISEQVNDVTLLQGETSGIRTTKTNMVTHVHVPDKHFLVLSGMIRNAKSQQKRGLPCLGGLPLVGSLFSKKSNHEEKRNIIIFVRPHIIHTVEEYQKVSSAQRELHRKISEKELFDQGMQLIPPQ
ncbi:MAG: hypothetical protein A2Z85_03675 [Chlamydiae bacterium GWA2_50_15]|nr:MAG: hypothetical protein A2Z85_03675 [Chlamydiae bacterium GWA2_50_15]